jgi:hypothetical protein
LKIIRPLLLLSSFVFLTSCSTNYGVANLGSQARYLEKPTYKGEKETGIYVSSQYYNNGGEGFNAGVKENSEWIDFAIHRSITNKNFNASYGIFGYTGNYDVRALEGFEGKKKHHGFGFMGELNTVIHLGRIDWRIIGARLAYTFEGGEYAQFRRDAAAQGLIDNRHPKNAVAQFAITQDIVFKANKFDVGVFVAYGQITTELGFSDTYITSSASIHVTYKDFTFVSQFFGGIFEQPIYAFGLQYKFK